MTDSTSYHQRVVASPSVEPVPAVDAVFSVTASVALDSMRGIASMHGIASTRGIASMRGTASMRRTGMTQSACAIGANERGRTETGANWLHTPKFGSTHHFQRWRPAT